MTPRELEQRIRTSPGARAGIVEWLAEHYPEEYGERDPYGEITIADLCKFVGVTDRTWRKWTSGQRAMPASAWRLLAEVSRVWVDGPDPSPPEAAN